MSQNFECLINRETVLCQFLMPMFSQLSSYCKTMKLSGCLSINNASQSPIAMSSKMWGKQTSCNTTSQLIAPSSKCMIIFKVKSTNLILCHNHSNKISSCWCHHCQESSPATASGAPCMKMTRATQLRAHSFLLGGSQVDMNEQACQILVQWKQLGISGFLGR